jgi:hypothetical protein
VKDTGPLNEGKVGVGCTELDAGPVSVRVEVTERVRDTDTLGLAEVLAERVAVREGVGVLDGVRVGVGLHAPTCKEVCVSHKAAPPRPPPPVPS